MSVAWVVLSIACVMILFGRAASALGRIVTLLVWLGVSALFLSTVP